MKEVLHVLHALEQQQCQLSVQEVKGMMAALTDQAAALVEAQRAAYQVEAEAASQAEAARRSEEEQLQRVCCICYDVNCSTFFTGFS